MYVEGKQHETGNCEMKKRVEAVKFYYSFVLISLEAGVREIQEFVGNSDNPKKEK